MQRRSKAQKKLVSSEAREGFVAQTVSEVKNEAAPDFIIHFSYINGEGRKNTLQYNGIQDENTPKLQPYKLSQSWEKNVSNDQFHKGS